MQNFKNEFNNLKQSVLNNMFNRMNDMQRQAIFKTNGPVLILAGAGSGKTTVLVNRIAYMLDFGNAYQSDYINDNVTSSDMDFLKSCVNNQNCDKQRLKDLISVYPPNPWNILAITFTNKAANELKERLQVLLGDVATNINAGTFHSICVRILRREIHALGYSSNFTIYDTDDSVRVIKDSMADLMVSDKMFAPKQVLGEISRAKDSMFSPKEFLEQNESDFRLKTIGNIYTLYQRKLKAANAVDFDDIIALTVNIFLQNPDVLDHYQNLYKYILVDEYQDTNHVQYKLVSLLADKNHNLCVVGDDDQSIYKFRGANIENILSFENQFEDATVIRLEQNYRSTQNILDAANELIKNNNGRKGKNLWTDQGEGDKIEVHRCSDQLSEADFVAKTIGENIAKGDKLSEHAILYRTNAQSNSIEQSFVRQGIPYKIVGGTKFFDRKEIKDILSYFQVINNHTDTVRIKRIINEPKRGIGDATVKTAQRISEELGISMFEVIKNSDTYDALSKKSKSLVAFSEIIEDLTDLSLNLSLEDLLDEVMEKTLYSEYLKSQGVEGQTRLENINELKTNLIKYEEQNPSGGLSGFLEEVSLYTDLDSLNSADDSVIMMTMHAAKGLEFNNVFVIGMEEGLFPSFRAFASSEELEEERRLAYVAVTRAKRNLYLTNCISRMLFGNTQRNQPSRFIREIPDNLINYVDDTIKSQFSMSFSPERESPAKPHINPEIAGVGVRSQVDSISIDYNIGDTVNHRVFGNGMVISITPMANDNLIEVAFDSVGTKKIMANFAKLKKQ